jgi:hypothetical protein
MSFPSNQQPTKVPKPSNGALHDPSFSIPPQFSSILQRAANSPRAMRTDQIDAVVGHHHPQPISVIGFVCDQAFGFALRSTASDSRHTHSLQRFFDERDFRGRRRRQGHSQRYTRAICHHQPLRTLSTLGFSDECAPFFAGEKLASAKHSSQSRCCFSSNCPSSARQAVRKTSCSSQSRRRRQHVLGDGYRSGKSFQRAPLRNTHKIPSKHGRFAMGLRPPNAAAFGSGNSAAIVAHCASVINSTVLAIEYLHSTTSKTRFQAWRKFLQNRLIKRL